MIAKSLCVDVPKTCTSDLLLVKENERIPADGLILSEAFVDESMITGESRAVNKKTNDLVYGGSLNQNQPFEMKVTTLGKDSFLNQVAELVKKAQAQKSNLENMADRVAGYLFYAALIVGIFSLIFWTISSNFSFALLLAVSVFVIACPHALGLAVPLVVSRLTSISAKNGLLIQNRTSLEKINTIKYALMDKTGTLTDGNFIVRNVINFTDETDILQIMAALEGSSTHPIAQSIVSAAKPLENLKVEAVEMVAKAIRRNRAGFSEGDQPIGSFLFVGPTGVGKTELAKQLALDMFGNENAIIRLDMSEYADRTAVSKLIGTSAGYVGYEDNANTLTERVRRNPYSIVLLDEIEKADPQVLTLLLQVMDDGRLTDGQGNVINFKNTIIIATSNAGFGNEALSGDKQRDQSLMDKLAPFFRPEFLNRFNGIVEFSHLTKQDLSQIVDLMLADVQKTLAKKSIKLEVTKAAKDWLMEQGYDEAMGARPLRRVIEQQIRDKVTDFYLDHLDAKNLKADLVDDEIVISAA